MSDDPDSEILLELNRIGNAMEVRAISVSDGLEVSFTAPANTIQPDIERLARSKLAYVRRKAQGDGASSDKKPGGKGGLIA
jgi:hypothetical protein